jgi:hypothetical protein
LLVSSSSAIGARAIRACFRSAARRARRGNLWWSDPAHSDFPSIQFLSPTILHPKNEALVSCLIWPLARVRGSGAIGNLLHAPSDRSPAEPERSKQQVFQKAEKELTSLPVVLWVDHRKGRLKFLSILKFPSVWKVVTTESTEDTEKKI